MLCVPFFSFIANIAKSLLIVGLIAVSLRAKLNYSNIKAVSSRSTFEPVLIICQWTKVIFT